MPNGAVSTVWPISSGTSSGFNNKETLPNPPVTIAWGTDGIYYGVIVKSIRSSRMVEEVNIENGSGIVSTQIIIQDGDQVEITVVDDRSVTFPDSTQVVTLLNPITPTGTLDSSVGGVLESFQVINNDYNVARKQDGERVLLAKRYVLITPH